MLDGTRRWFRRNRTRFAVGAGTLGLVYLAGQYAWSKWLEAQQRMSEERISKENLRRRFEQNQEDCTYTVLALLPTIREEVIGALPVEEITHELQRQRAEKMGKSEAASSEFPSAAASTVDDDKGSMSSFQSGSYIHASQMVDSQDAKAMLRRKTKTQLWNDMKIGSITRAITLLYTLSLLTLLTRIQLNLLGRRTYLSSVVSLANPPSNTQASQISMENNDDDNYDNVYGNDFETNRKYLTFSWWLLHKGTKQIVEKVNAAVREVFGPLNPREDITLERLSQLVLEVRKKVEGATETERREQKWLSYMLPPREQEDMVLQESGIDAMGTSPAPQDIPTDPLSASQSATSLRKLLDETSDLIDSPTFTHVFTQLLNATFSNLIDNRIATEAFKISPPAPESLSRVTEITDKKCKFAQTLAVFCRQAHVIAAGSGEPDDLAVAESGSQVNEYLAAIDHVKDLEAFAAVIYSSNFEFETAEQREQQQYDDKQVLETVREADISIPTIAIAQEEPITTEETPAPATDAFEDAWSRNRTAPHEEEADTPTYSKVLQSTTAQEDQSSQQDPLPSQETPQEVTATDMAKSVVTSTIPPLTLIVAATSKNGIGKNGTLPWPMLKKEMAYFSRVTKRVPSASASLPTSLSSGESQATESTQQQAQNVVVMGRKTWESIPPKFRPLPQRTNVVITRSPSLEGASDDVIIADSITSGLESLTSKAENGQAKPIGRVFVIGGAGIYKAALEMKEASRVLLTRVEGEWDCDTEFPVDVEGEGWRRGGKEELDGFVGEEVEEKMEEEVKGQKVGYEFRVYERV